MVSFVLAVGVLIYYFATSEQFFSTVRNGWSSSLITSINTSWVSIQSGFDSWAQTELNEKIEIFWDIKITSSYQDGKISSWEVQNLSEEEFRDVCQGRLDITEYPPFGENSYRIDLILSGSIYIEKYSADVYKKYCLPEYEKTIEYINQWFPIPSEVACQRLSILDWWVCVLKDVWMYDIGSIWKIKFYISTSPQDFIIELHWYAVISWDVYYVKYMDDSYYEKRQKEIETNMKNEYALQWKDDRKDPYDSTTTNLVVNDQWIYQYSLEIAKKIATAMENIF